MPHESYWHDLPPRDVFLTAAEPDTGGVFINTPCGPVLLRGSPLRAKHFCLRRDRPGWDDDQLDPRKVRLNIRRFRELRARLGRGRNRQRDGNRTDGQVYEPRLEDLKAVMGLFGPKRCRLLDRIPPTSSPFLLAWLADLVPTFARLLDQAAMLAVLVALDGSELYALSLDELRIAVSEEVSLRRRDILDSHGFPAKVAAAFGKITPAGADVQLLSRLRTALSDPAILKAFTHARCVGPDLMAIFAQPTLFRAVSGSFLQQLARLEPRKHDAAFAPILKTAVFYGDQGLMRRRVFTSPRKLLEWQDQMAAQIATEEARSLVSMSFGSAPVPDEPGLIEQIREGRELLGESLSQSNCVANREYVARITAGEAWVFRVHRRYGLERATALLEIVGRTEDGEPVYGLTEVECRAGRPPSRRTLDALRVWLEDARVRTAERQDASPHQLGLFS